MEAYKVVGVIWDPDKPDDLIYTLSRDGQYFRAIIPVFTERCRRRARDHGVSLGVIADEVNAAIQDWEEKTNPPLFKAVQVNVSDEQFKALGRMFGFEVETRLPDHAVDGSSE